MKQTQQSAAMAGLLAVALAISGCAAMRSGGSSTGASGISGSSGSSGTQSIQNGAGFPGNSSMQDDRAASASTAGSTAASAAPNSTVLAIERMPASGGITEGDSSMGSSGTAGTSGSAYGGPSYRVTVRMDDGSAQVLTQKATPDFRSGDRVNVTRGAIQR